MKETTNAVVSKEGWISVEDGLPEEGQIVDIWEMPMTHHLKRHLSLKGTDYANKYYSDQDYAGWRSCNYKFKREKDDEGVINVFEKCVEKYLRLQTSYSYKSLCVENGEVSHWRPLPPPPGQPSKPEIKQDKQPHKNEK